jgi:hypothetical protein
MIWKTITAYPAYEVSDIGRVRLSVGTHKSKAGFEPKQEPDTKGYLRVALYCGGTRRYLSVHRLVAEAFLPNPLALPTVNHKHEPKTNNSVDNLEWSSYKRQMIHAQQTGLRSVRGYSYKPGNLKKPWRVQLEMGGRANREVIYRESFTTEEEAKTARAKVELHYQNLEVIT